MCTGETHRVNLRHNSQKVYPHVYGGNTKEQVPYGSVVGLSPCVRGKPYS